MSELKQTPLYNLHLELGARMVAFAGYNMPVQYKLGLLKEHQHVRAQVGLFDVSHMGQIRLSGRHVAAEMEKLVPVDVINLAESMQRYALLTNEAGGILDDFMMTNAGDHLFAVVNADCKVQDIAYMRAMLSNQVQLDVLDHALIALQGPIAANVLVRFAPDCEKLLFMQASHLVIDGTTCFVSRSGYTGEDGYEISIPMEAAERITRLLLAESEVEAIGLGARDSLRLEAGLCLYGHDLDHKTTPVESSLLWALSKSRRANGERAGGYPGAEVIQRQQVEGVSRKRVGLCPQSRVPVREGTELVDVSGRLIGIVTSGGYGPTLGAPVAMGYVETAFSALDTEVFAMVRGKSLAMRVTKMPFVPQGYYRG